MKAAQAKMFGGTQSGPATRFLAAFALFLSTLAATGRAQMPTPTSIPSPSALPAQGSTLPDTAAPARASVPRQTRTADRSDSPAADRGREFGAQGRAPDLVAVPIDTQTEFQQLVVSTIGRSLPIFGASLFSGVPSTFAPVQDIPVTPDYILGPGDELRLEVWGQVNLQDSYTIDRTGAISIPEVGTVHVAGLQFSQVTSYLRSRLERVYRNFDLNVNVGQLRSIQVFVVGQARRPGSYTVSSLSTLLNALFASGGPLPQGSLRDIQLRRGGATVTHFDLYDLLLHGDKTKDVELKSGDVIFIPEAGPQIAILGSVNNPAIYELRSETTVTQALALAGGSTSTAGGSQVRLERVLDHQMRTTVDVNLANSGDATLQNGDILSVPTIIDRFKDTVTLRGNVASPGRYVWHPGMRITDLIPSRDALITRDYWLRRNQLGQAGAYTGPYDQGALQVATTATAGDRRTATTEAGGSSIGVALTGDSSSFPAKTDVVLSAPDINWSYAVIERQDAVTLTTSLIPFTLGKIILEGDQSQNLALLPGDVVTIFSKADLSVPTAQRTRYIRLEGEFNASGVYSVLAGETLRGLLRRAGAFTPDAYLYASEFTRESTRRVQVQRLREYADQLEAQVTSSIAQSSSRAINDRDAAAALTQAQEARVTIERLRRASPIGRIVLAVKPDSRGVDSVPDLELEDGDRFVVPRVPSSVSVEGQVYNANAFVFTRERHVLDYLKQAGGPDRSADHRREFVLRADGSVYSRQYGNVEHAKVFPGDTIVVPPQLHKTALLRDLIDIGTIVGQFGIGAAAINVLK